jgi:OTU domain-containing protein 3
MEGEDGDHMEYRGRVVDYIAAHEDDFAPFVEDDVPFEKYLQEMREDGTWAGHMELQATSLLTRANICIHKVARYY